MLNKSILTLDHEIWDDSMKSRSSIAKSILACAQLSKVLHRLGHNVAIETHHNPSGFLASDRDVKVYLLGNLQDIKASPQLHTKY